MRKACCREEAILQAHRTGQWTGVLTDHKDACETCQRVIQICGWMKNLEQAARVDEPLPSADFMWLKAHFLERLSREERALRPLLWAEVLVRGVVALILGIGIGEGWMRAQTMLVGVLERVQSSW